MQYSVFISKRLMALLSVLFFSMAAVVLLSIVSPVVAAQEIVHSAGDGHDPMATEESAKLPDTVFDSLSQTHILYSGSKGLPLFKTANTM